MVVYPALCPGPLEREIGEEREGQENVRNEERQSGDVRYELCVPFTMPPKKKRGRRKPESSENN